MDIEATEKIDNWVLRLMAAHHDRQTAIDKVHISLMNADLLSKVTVHRYQCSKGCQIAIVFRTAGLVLCWVSGYKYSPGLNASVSVESARKHNTIDGERHWPSHVYDVVELDEFSAGNDQAGMSMNCRHYRGTVLAADVLKAVEGVTPGKPGKPTRL